MITPTISLSGFQVGLLLRFGSFWIGGHWSDHTRRLCINLLPMVTVFIVFPGGAVPRATSNSTRCQQLRKISAEE